MDALAAAVSGLKGIYGDDILYQVCANSGVQEEAVDLAMD
jgi:hypothetical protein